MYETCSYCGNQKLIMQKSADGSYCCDEFCRRFAKCPPGFCAECLAQTTGYSAGNTTTHNSIGTMLWDFGRGDECGTCNSKIQTKFFCIGWIPLIPLGSFRVIDLGRNRYLSRSLIDEPTPWPIRLRQRLRLRQHLDDGMQTIGAVPKGLRRFAKPPLVATLSPDDPEVASSALKAGVDNQPRVVWTNLAKSLNGDFIVTGAVANDGDTLRRSIKVVVAGYDEDASVIG